jgi:tight adherence protein B
VINATDDQELREVFSNEARILANQVLITVAIPKDTTKSEGTLAVQVAAEGVTYSDAAFVSIPPSVTRQRKVTSDALRPVASSAVSSTVMLGGLLGIGLGLLGLVLATFGRRGKSDVSLESRIAPYTGKGATQRLSKPPQGAKAQAVDLANRALASNRSFEARLGSRLEGAGVSLKPAEWLLLHAAITIGFAAVVFLLTAGDGLLSAVALVAGVALPWMYLGRKRSKRLKSFNAQLPATLQLMAGSLQAGLSLSQGMDTIVREGADPVAGEFRRALVETRLGVQVEEALGSVAERMGSDDFRWTVMAVRIQRDVGGNLAELMLNVAATMREREYLRRQVKSLSAEGKFSAYILLSMPPAILLYEVVSNRAYVQPMLSTPLGWVMLAAMGLLMGLGSFMMMRLIKLEV